MKKYIGYSLMGTLFAACNLCGYTLKAQNNNPVTAVDTTVVELKYSAPKSAEPEPLLKVPAVQSVSAISTVSGTTLAKTPVANITNTLYGLLPGLSVAQGSGEPGYDGAGLSIRGRGSYDNSGLIIYVDGFQTNSSYFSYLSPSEIESISILKDPVTLSTFGMRGANGVLWVVTKRGMAKKPTVQAQVVTGWQQPITIYKPYDSYDYARLYNQAISNDNYSLNGYQFKWTPQYSDAQLEEYKNGKGSNVDWYDEVLKKSGRYTDANVTLSGGDLNTKYALILDYMQQRGMYDVATNATNSNAQIQRFNIRSNLDFNFFKIFEAKVDLGGRIEDRRYPSINGGTLWNNMALYPSNIYPVKDTVTGNWSGTTLFPNNPLASLRALGWASTHDRTLQANFNLKERLDFITPGLYLNEAVSFNTWTRSSASKTATYARFNNGVKTTTDNTTDIISNGTSPTNQYDWKQVHLTAGYDRIFGVHTVSAAVNYFVSDYVIDNGNQFEGQNRGNNIFYHFQNLGGRFHYGYNSRYLLELGFGYSGSDYYAPGKRWAFYPSVAAGWVASNEAFLKNSKTISFLKLRASAGKSGGELSNRGRYLYQQYYISTGGYNLGGTALTSISGYVPSYAANLDIVAEQSMKYNLGADVTLFNKVSLTADGFLDKRSGIITQNNELSALYGAAVPYANIGKVTNRGFEMSASYSDKIGAVNFTIGAMAAYAKNKIDYQAEIAPENDFSKTTGLAIGTPMGLIADGFYDISDFNANGTLKAGIPVPAFGSVQPGDIRYKDIDGNNKVNQNDLTRIGKPDYTDLTYAFNVAVNFKGFDLTALFQGAAGKDINLLSAAYNQTVAFVNNSNVYSIANNAWAYFPEKNIDTRATADYPRLTTKGNDNNYRNSTFWMKNGNFLRLRNVELGYVLPAPVLNKLHLEKLRVYVSAVNPFSWSSLNKNYNIDPETTSGYPGLKSVNTGISLTF